MWEEYLVILSWLFVAIGTALLGGTGLALLHYRRTGSFPGQPNDESSGSERVSPRTAVTKCVVGALLLVWGMLSLTTSVGWP
jgi:hypothetical protein